MKVVSVLIGSLAATGASLAQGSWATVPNWPTSTIEAFAIHQCHLRPANPAMGNKGRFMFCGRMNGSSSEPWIWDPYANGGAGTFTLSAPVGLLDYELFCCGQTLMKNGKVIAAGSNFDSNGVPAIRRRLHT